MVWLGSDTLNVTGIRDRAAESATGYSVSSTVPSRLLLRAKTDIGSHPMTLSAKLDSHLCVLRYQACAFLRGPRSDN